MKSLFRKGAECCGVVSWNSQTQKNRHEFKTRWRLFSAVNFSPDIIPG
jgi:hypothetical protein